MAQPASLDWPTLVASLREAERLSRELLDLLECERNALEQRDYAAFERLLADKTELVMALERNTRERSGWLQHNGFADERAALNHADTAAPALANAWRKLATLWEQCQQASLINEQISQRTRMVVGRMLDLLSGNAGQGSVYDSQGATRRAQSGRNITSV
jgi:flagellar biosynthesis/type III secretory pathway chaperone